MPSFKEEKLRVNLRLCINRLKLLEKKKTEQALKARKEIADYIKAGRIERARIRVEHIIREDYLVEAMEVVELYCDLMLARFGMIATMQYCEDSLIESVSTLIWIAPRLVSDIQELAVVEKQLENKFGKEFAQQARSNMSGTVNPKVIHRLGLEAPKKSLVENYMIEIARNYKIEYAPDTSALLDDDALIPGSGASDEKPYFPPGDGGEGDNGYRGGGGEGIYVQDPTTIPQPQGGLPYPQPVFPPQAGPLPTKGQPMMPQMPQPTQLPPPQQQGGYSQPAPPYTETALPYPTDNGMLPGQQPPPIPNTGGPLPTVPPPNGGGLDLPPVPTSGFPPSTGVGVTSSTGSDAGGGGDVDFDDLTRRFEELKRRR